MSPSHSVVAYAGLNTGTILAACINILKTAIIGVVQRWRGTP